MVENEVYKYLGMNQINRIATTTVTQKLTIEFKSRLHKIAKSNLTGKHLIKAINTYAIPSLTYSFGIINWTITDLQTLQRRIKKILSSYKLPKSSLERMITPRKEGGRGLLDLQGLYDNQTKSLRNYFITKSATNSLVKAITEADNNFTPLNMGGNFFRTANDQVTTNRNW